MKKTPANILGPITGLAVVLSFAAEPARAQQVTAKALIMKIAQLKGKAQYRE